MRSLFCLAAIAIASFSCVICGAVVPGQLPVGGHSRGRSGLRKPRSIVEPEQASGRKVTAAWVCLDGERERGAHLIAVKRTVTGGVHPARIEPRPFGKRGASWRVAGLAAFEVGAAGTEIFARRAAQETAEAEAFVVEHDRLIRIAFAGGDGIAQARDQKIAHRDLGREALRGAVRQADIDAGEGRRAVAHAQLQFIGAEAR